MHAALAASGGWLVAAGVERERERETGGYDLTTCCFGASFETRDRNSVIARRHEDMSMVGHTTFWSINAGPLSGLQVTAGGEGSSALLPGWRNNNPEKNKQTGKKNTNRKKQKSEGLGVLQRDTLGARCSCGGLSGARCLDCMASLIESDVSRECHVRVLLIC